MANAEEGSVAPTERVNIVYRPATAGAKEDVELPLKMLITGDFTGAADERPVEERQPVSVDKDNFNDVLKAQNCRLTLNVPNKMVDTPEAELAVELTFNSMADFTPDEIAAQVPEIQALVEM